MRGVKAKEGDGLMARLVDEAAKILVEAGPTGLSLRKVAAAAGVSTMPVYTLFGDKRGLLAAMHREAFLRLGELMRAVPSGDDPLADLAALGLAYREAAVRSPNLYGLMFGNEAAATIPDPQGQAAAEATYRPLVEAVIRCQSAGRFREGDPERIALHLWAVVHGMVSLELNSKISGPESAEERYAEALTFAAMPFLRAP